MPGSKRPFMMFPSDAVCLGIVLGIGGYTRRASLILVHANICGVLLRQKMRIKVGGREDRNNSIAIAVIISLHNEEKCHAKLTRYSLLQRGDFGPPTQL